LLLLKKFQASSSSSSSSSSSLLSSFQSNILPARTVELVELSGNSALRYEIVNLEKLDEATIRFLENNALQRVAMALRSLVVDEIARSALQKVHVVRIENVASLAEGAAKLENGVLVSQGNFAQLSSCPSDVLLYRTLDEALGISFARMRVRVEQQLKTREKEIFDELGPKVALLPEWSTFTTTPSLEFLDNVGGLRLLMALRTAAADPTSKSMVASAIKTVVFRNVR
jgi:hypothetical protein